ncbi:prepilin peptidase [Brevundimonas sp.]|jgi:leader peptidase (prepilin peptidase)/N-methyltransferase|uniref:prepilin peptidase n=1 Tax=Brevundimonas sp. TaxID=1871086 RepID=UPI00378505AB
MPQPVVIAILLGLLGTVVGSFLAAVTVRLPREEGVVFGRSRCMSCEQTLAPAHLVPVLSWLWLKGKCGWCRAAISPRYILIELAAAAIGAWAALAGGDWVFVAATAVLGWQLLLIAIIDAENFWLPDILTWPLAATGLIAVAVLGQAIPWAQIIGAVAGFGSLWLLAWTYKRLRGRDGLGGGDPFLFGAAGAWVGWMGLPSVLLWACLAGFAVVMARLIVRRAVSGSDRLPFGSLLAIGIWLTWLYGPIGA